MAKLRLIKIFKIKAFCLAVMAGLLFMLAPAPSLSALADPGTGTRTDTTSQTQPTQQKSAQEKKIAKDLENNPIVKDINTIINALSAGVGIIVIIAIIVGGIQYVLAGDNAQHVAAARQRILNALIALVAFIFMWAFLQWLVPGGIFSTK